METTKTFQLPTLVISPTDIARLVRELEVFDEFYRQSDIRQDTQQAQPPRATHLLDELTAINKGDLAQVDSRATILSELRTLAESAPVMHISFSVDPPGQYVQKIVAWLRSNIDPFILVRVGLQPTIGAGCIVRTANKSFDFSLRQYFENKHDFFMKKLHAAVTPTALELAAEQAMIVAAPADTLNDNSGSKVVMNQNREDDSVKLAQQEIQRAQTQKVLNSAPPVVAPLNLQATDAAAAQSIPVRVGVKSTPAMQAATAAFSVPVVANTPQSKPQVVAQATTTAPTTTPVQAVAVAEESPS